MGLMKSIKSKKTPRGSNSAKGLGGNTPRDDDANKPPPPEAVGPPPEEGGIAPPDTSGKQYLPENNVTPSEEPQDGGASPKMNGNGDGSKRVSKRMSWKKVSGGFKTVGKLASISKSTEVAQEESTKDIQEDPKVREWRRKEIEEHVALEQAAEKMRRMRKSTQFSVSKKMAAPVKRIHILHMLQLGFIIYLVICAMIIKLFSPSLLWMLLGTLVAFPAGVGLSFLFQSNFVSKNETKGKLMIDPGVHGLHQLLHQMPSWVNYQEKEKVQWLNKILSQAWPFYDRAICNEIKTAVEPALDEYKPSFIAKIGFRKLTFGLSPFKIDTIWVDQEQDDKLVMEIVFRWQGDANIGLFINLQGLSQLGGEATSMVVKLTKLQLSGHLRIAFDPLVDKIPGFGAVTAALTQSPIIKYQLDFGKALGSGFSAGLVRSWLDPFIRNTLVELLVWPERIIVPMVPEEDMPPGTMEGLKKRLKGILQVTVVSAKGIKVMDGGLSGGAADPFVSMWSNPQRRIETSVQKGTLTPEWNETYHVLVQEPRTQVLKVELYDYDAISLKELGTGLNIFKNLKNTVGARDIMGRCIVNVKPYSMSPGQDFEETFDLGLQDWSSLGGPGKGEGRLTLKMNYAPIQSCRGMGFKTGVVVVKVMAVKGLNILTDSSMLLYIKMKMTKKKHKLESRPVTMFGPHKDKQTHETKIVDPQWNSTHSFYEIRKDEELVVKVVEKDSVSDETQGVAFINLEDFVIKEPDSTVTKWFELEETNLPSGNKAYIQLRVEWAGFIPEEEGWEERDAGLRNF